MTNDGYYGCYVNRTLTISYRIVVVEPDVLLQNVKITTEYTVYIYLGIAIVATIFIGLSVVRTGTKSAAVF